MYTLTRAILCYLVETTFPPVFNKRLEGTVTLLEGKRLFLEVDVFAVPPPNVTWTMAGGKQLREGVVVSSDTPTRFSFAIPEGTTNHYSACVYVYTSVPCNNSISIDVLQLTLQLTLEK